MGVLDWLRKGFGYVLLTMGISRPGTAKKKPVSTPKPDSQRN